MIKDNCAAFSFVSNFISNKSNIHLIIAQSQFINVYGKMSSKTFGISNAFIELNQI